MDFKYSLEHYESSNNKRKEDVIDFILDYNEEFDMSIKEQTNTWLLEDEEDTLEGREAVNRYYEDLCDELIVVLDEGSVIACRFIEFDENEEYFRSRVDNYELGLNLTFALVDKEYRGEGIWNKMFEYVENQILPNYSVKRIYLATSSKNTEMQSAVESKGFIKSAVIEDERGEGVDSILYFKEYR